MLIHYSTTELPVKFNNDYCSSPTLIIFLIIFLKLKIKPIFKINKFKKLSPQIYFKTLPQTLTSSQMYDINYEENFTYWKFTTFRSKIISQSLCSQLNLFFSFVKQNNEIFNKYLFAQFIDNIKHEIKKFKKVWKHYFKIYLFFNFSLNRISKEFSSFAIFSRNLLTLFFNLYWCLTVNSVWALFAQKNLLLNKINHYFFFWNFKHNNTFFASLRLISPVLNKTLTFLSPGMFIKFFQNKKSYKKHKLTKFLIIKFFRKMFVISRLWKLTLAVKRLPSLFLELLKFFRQPVYLKFQKQRSYLKYEDYVYKKKITKSEFHSPFLLFYYFFDSKSYTSMKLKKKGRIKRKISRKLIITNNIVD